MNMSSDTWRRAIAIRQPWAWAVVHAGKDVENRSETAIRAYRLAVGCRVYIHASKGMTRVEYERAVEFMASIGVRCPALDEFQFGGIIGSVLVTGIITASRSLWFRGPHALALADPRPERFRPVRGQVGLWRVQTEPEPEEDPPWTVWEYWHDDPDPPQKPMTRWEIEAWSLNVGKLMGWTKR
jgi:hypothetical protein